MPSDMTDVSFAAASVLCMMLARSDAFATFDGLNAKQRATALGSATVVIAVLACVLAQLLVVIFDFSSPQLLPFFAMAFCIAIIHVATLISRRVFPPLHLLLQQLQPQLLPTTLLSAASSMLISPAPTPLHAAIYASLCALTLAVLLHISLWAHKRLSVVPQLNALPQHSLHFHALSLAMAAVLAGIGSMVLGLW